MTSICCGLESLEFFHFSTSGDDLCYPHREGPPALNGYGSFDPHTKIAGNYGSSSYGIHSPKKITRQRPGQDTRDPQPLVLEWLAARGVGFGKTETCTNCG